MGVSYAPNVVRNGLVLCLDAANAKSYPGSGTAWNDLSGTGNNATLVNGPSYSSTNSGLFGLDGVNDYVTTGPSNITGNNPWSVCLWAKVNSSESGTGRRGWLLWEGPNSQSANGLIGLCVTGGKLEVANWVDDTVFQNSSITFGAFQYIVVTFNGSQELIYLNGANTDSKTITLAISNGSWFIGCRAGASEFLQSEISVFHVYNRALSAAEVAQNFNATRSRYGL